MAPVVRGTAVHEDGGVVRIRRRRWQAVQSYSKERYSSRSRCGARRYGLPSRLPSRWTRWVAIQLATRSPWLGGSGSALGLRGSARRVGSGVGAAWRLAASASAAMRMPMG